MDLGYPQDTNRSQFYSFKGYISASASASKKTLSIRAVLWKGLSPKFWSNEHVVILAGIPWKRKDSPLISGQTPIEKLLMGPAAIIFSGSHPHRIAAVGSKSMLGNRFETLVNTSLYLVNCVCVCVCCKPFSRWTDMFHMVTCKLLEPAAFRWQAFSDFKRPDRQPPKRCETDLGRCCPFWPHKLKNGGSWLLVPKHLSCRTKQPRMLWHWQGVACLLILDVYHPLVIKNA